MHGCNQGFPALLNAEVDSMGGVYNGGISIDTKNSPRQAAIEKAQAELRLEYDVREERRRELEFLERGGNPLDFRFGPPTSASVQSTSLADNNEAKGSFAAATSPQGDSVESSGRPGTHIIREPNIADNLLLLDGVHSVFNEEENGMRSKRKKASEQTTKRDLSRGRKDSEESSILHLTVKGQAYARRNRSKSNREARDNARTDFTTTTRVPTLSSSHPNIGRPIIPSVDEQTDDHDSAIGKLKPSTSDEKNGSKTLVLENRLTSDVEGLTVLQPSGSHIDAAEVAETRAKVSAADNLRESNDKDQFSQAGDEQSPGAAISAPSGPLVKKKPVAENEVCGEDSISKSVVINGCENFRKRMGLQNESQANGKCIVHPGTDTLTCSSSGSEPPAIKKSATTDITSLQGPSDAPAGGNIVVIKEQNSAYKGDAIPGTVDAKENGDLTTVDLQLDGKVEPCPPPSHASDAHASLSVPKHGDPSDVRTGIDGAGRCEILDGRRVDGELISQPEKKFDSSSSYTSDIHGKASLHQTMRAENVISSIHESSDASLSKKSSATAPEVHVGEGNNLKMAKKSSEDAILKEARAIEAKCRKAKEPPAYHFLLEKHTKSHWDYVLEEMAWLANDFMQERLWKITAAAQICHRIAVSGQSVLENKNLCQMQRRLAQVLAESVKGFWHFAEKNRGLSEEDLVQSLRLPVRRYAVRFLQSNHSRSHSVPAEAPRTPDRISDEGILEMSWEEHISDVKIFYNVPYGAMRAYGESMEAYWLQHKPIDGNVQQVDCEASVGDSGTELKNQGNALEDDDDVTTMYHLPKAFEANRLLTSPKKTKGFQKKSSAYRSPGTGFDVSYASSLENKMGNQSSLGKRPAALNVGSIPTKRVRTATRQRLGPLGANATGVLQVTSKTDVSSGDTNSFQDDESSLPGFSQRKTPDVELTVDFERQVSFDGAEVTTKTKKKKPKQLGYKTSMNSTDCGGPSSLGKGSSYDRKWSMDSLTQVDQVDLSKRKLEVQHFESSGPSGPYAQFVQKKPKVLKQLREASPEAVTPSTRPLPSPVASQMSNLSNSNKLIKVMQSRDRGKKSKAHKGATGQSGSGSAWSQFEDQALVVLVHDMGPNWELVSDAINSTLQFKCIFRKPKECKERHKVLMDKNAGDGADSAEDSGSSQPYPSTLPGIPKGSARQLFQRLQGPLEEDTIKAHFEKIIAIGQKLHPRRVQDNQELKQTNPVHNSHFQALSQACPNNLSGGPLTPLDLCDANTPNPDTLIHGYQGPHSSGIGLPNQQGSLTPTLASSGANSLIQGSPGMVMGNNFPSPSGPANAPIRDAARFGMPRPTSLPVDDQQRVQYNPMLPSRTVPGAFSGGVERGIRMLSGGNGVGMMCGMNLGMPAHRPGFQGIGSPGVLNMVSSSNMLSSNGVGIPNIHHGSVSSHGGSTMRSHESLQPRTFPVQQQQPHQISQGPQQPHVHGNPHHPHIHGSSFPNPQNQAYAMRLAKERQQRLLQQKQQQQFSGSTAATPLQGSSQLQQPSQPSSPLPPISPSHSQHKQQAAAQNPPTSAPQPNQIMKQRRQQLQQQQPRQQPQQQQPAQQQAKLMKGAGRGAVLMHQNLPVDASYMNGPSTSPRNQILEKHMVHPRQAFYSGSSGVSGSNMALPQASQQKMYRAPPQSSKVPPITSQADSSNQGQAQIPPDQSLVVSQPPSAPSVSSQNQQQRQSNQPHQTMHRIILQQNRQLNSDSPMHSGIELAQSNQMRSTTAMPQSMDSTNAIPDVTSGPLSSSHWKPERSFEAGAPAAPIAQMASSPQSNLVGGMEPLMPSSGHGLMQRQFSASFPVHGHGNGGHWQQQQQQLQSQQPPASTLTHQQQHRHPVQGALYGRPSPNP